MQSAHSRPSERSNERFLATRWSLVAAAGLQDDGAARRALIELCLRYWYPVYAYVRGSGQAAELAQDLSRAFFEELLHQRLLLEEVRARGRFREYLLDALQQFLARDWRQARELAPVPEFEQPIVWNHLEARYQNEAAAGLSPEQTYQRSYALEVLANALARLRHEAEEAGRTDMFEAMQPWLSAEPGAAEFEQLAQGLSIRPLAAVVALKRLRQRYRELAEAELAETVANAGDLAAERAALARTLGQR